MVPQLVLGGLKHQPVYCGRAYLEIENFVPKDHFTPVIKFKELYYVSCSLHLPKGC